MKKFAVILMLLMALSCMLSGCSRKCKVKDCDEVTIEGSKYCDEHTCMVSKCFEEVENKHLCKNHKIVGFFAADLGFAKLGIRFNSDGTFNMEADADILAAISFTSDSGNYVYTPGEERDTVEIGDYTVEVKIQGDALIIYGKDAGLPVDFILERQ